MANHFVGYIDFSNSYLDNTKENQKIIKDFLHEIKIKYPEILGIDFDYVDSITFFDNRKTIQTIPIPLNCELAILRDLQILQVSDIKYIPDELLGLSCRISGKFLSLAEEEICKVNSIEYLDKIERYHLWTGTDSELFHMTESNIHMHTDFIPFTAQNINEIDEDYFYYDFNTVYGLDMFFKALFTSYYDDIVHYHYEKMIPIPSDILRIMSSNYLEYDDKLQDFLLLAKEVFSKYAHESNFAPESIQNITLVCRADDLTLHHRNFSKSLNDIMQELISETDNYLVI